MRVGQRDKAPIQHAVPIVIVADIERTAQSRGHLGDKTELTTVVTTTHINWPYFDDIGTPQSEQLELVERYMLSDDETRLDYLLTVTDPEMLTEPVTFDGYWTWIPGEQIKRYDCAVPDL